MDWSVLKAKRPRDQWGQFRSKADIQADIRSAQLESMQAMQEQLAWEAQQRREEFDP
jgi:hypothetical protein